MLTVQYCTQWQTGRVATLSRAVATVLAAELPLATSDRFLHCCVDLRVDLTDIDLEADRRGLSTRTVARTLPRAEGALARHHSPLRYQARHDDRIATGDASVQFAR